MTQTRLGRTVAALSIVAAALILAPPAQARIPSPTSHPGFAKVLPAGWWTTTTATPRHHTRAKVLPAGWWAAHL